MKASYLILDQRAQVFSGEISIIFMDSCGFWRKLGIYWKLKKKKRKKEKRKKRKKNWNQDEKWKRAKRKKERERKSSFFGINKHLNHVRVCCKEWRKEKNNDNLSRHEGIGSDHPFKWLAKALCLLSYSHQKKETKATKAKISYRSKLKKTHWSVMIMRITPWFDGKWLAKSIYDVFVIWNWEETLASVRFYTPLSGFPPFYWI